MTQRIKTEKLLFGGNFLAKTEEKTIFVPYALPDEELEVEITEEKPNYKIAKIKKIITPSPNRVEPPCKYYEKCGGCNLMHSKSDYQLELRKNLLFEIISREGIDFENIQIVTGPNFGYRARFQLNNGGLSENHSNNIIPIENCLCAEKIINDYLENTKFEDRPKGRVHIFGSEFCKNSEKNFIICETVDKNVQKSRQPVNFSSKKYAKNHKFIVKSDSYFSGTFADEKNEVSVNLLDKEICFNVRGFFQSNLFVFEKAAEIIRENLFECENIIDFYAGSASLSVFAADKCKKIFLVEHNRDALVYAEKNLAGVNHISFGLSGENWVKNCSKPNEKFDAIIVDPPRSGMEKSVREFIATSGANQIFSLSCDPVTHARDLKFICQNGYEINKFYLLDFYPNTAHIETLCELRRKYGD